MPQTSTNNLTIPQNYHLLQTSRHYPIQAYHPHYSHYHTEPYPTTHNQTIQPTIMSYPTYPTIPPIPLSHLSHYPTYPTIPPTSCPPHCLRSDGYYYHCWLDYDTGLLWGQVTAGLITHFRIAKD